MERLAGKKTSFNTVLERITLYVEKEESVALWMQACQSAVYFNLRGNLHLFILSFHVFSPQTRRNHFYTLDIDARNVNAKKPHRLLLCPRLPFARAS